MKFCLIICTFQRPGPLLRLLESVKDQEIYPDQILIIDSSENNKTADNLKKGNFKNLEYFKVGADHKGLTRQRNFGVSKVVQDIEILFFLDDDTILNRLYFWEILDTYKKRPEAIGVSGYIVNEVNWRPLNLFEKIKRSEFIYDSWVRIEGSRFSLRRKFGLQPDRPPGFMPSFSHGYSTGFLPPSKKTYQVEMLMGGIASYKKELFKKIKFSHYFEGYGLYEDADFSLRASKLGKLYVNTAAEVEHHHEKAGRPNKFRYGIMVVRNGWYVWRLKYPEPPIKSILKWHATSFLLTLVRLGNSITGRNKQEAFTEGFGRIWGWVSLLFNSPKIPLY